MAVVQSEKVANLIIDTDVGLDDATALIMCCAAEKKRQANIWGVTCVHGNTTLESVCSNTLKTLSTMGRRDIPVFRGASDSLVKTSLRAENIHGSDGFGNAKFLDSPVVDDITLQKEHAVNFLTRIASEKPGAVTLLCLGPLTNIALAIRMDPSFCGNIKEVFIMGGNTEGVGNTTAAAEFNFFCDPEAAYVVLHNMKCPISIFPWEAAYKHGRIPCEWRRNVLGAIQSPQARLMNAVERDSLERKGKDGVWIQCDPLAAAILFLPKDAVQIKQVYASVELHGLNTRGAMVVDHLNTSGLEPNVSVVEKVDLEAYKGLLLEAFAPEMAKF